MNGVQDRIRNGTFDVSCQTNQADEMDEVFRQQLLVKQRGQCEFGCNRSELIQAWPFEVSPHTLEVTGIQTVCRWTRMPCKRIQTSVIFKLYRTINRES